jgi:HEAT repeat protein
VKEQPENSSNHAHKGIRPVLLFGFLAAGAVVLATVFFLSTRSKPAGSQPGLETNTAASVATAGDAGTGLKQNVAARIGETGQTSLEQLIKSLNDTSLPLNERKKAIQALARNGSLEALTALKKALDSSPSDIRQAIAEALGECPSAEALTMLVELLKDSDPDVARAAVRGLARQEQPQAASALAQAVNDSGASADVRCEAALALGNIHEPWVLDPLSRAARQTDDEDVARAALEGISRLDFAATKGFFEDFLQSSDVPCDLRVAAVETLAHVEGDTTAFLAGLAARNPDPEIRVAAAWAMSATEVAGDAGPDILNMLTQEADPDVRLRLYQALRNQGSFDTATAMALVQNEQDPSARVAGDDLLAKMLRDNPTPQLQSYFDQTVIPELKQVALTGDSLDSRQAAVIALARAHTPEATAALADLSSQVAQMQNAASPPARQTGSPGTPGQH